MPREVVSQIKGFLIPVFVERDENGTELNGLTEGDFRLVRDGYACAHCLAYFDRYTTTCPACGIERDWEGDLPDAPELWLAHLREREQAEPTPRRTIDPMEEIRLMGKRGEIEDVPLRTLRPSRPGARRS